MAYWTLLPLIAVLVGAKTVRADEVIAPAPASLTLPGESAKSFAPEFKWSGDIRVRSQIEKKDDGEARPTNRIRARFGVGIKIQDDLKAVIRLATATGSRSTNQSLGDSGAPGAARRYVGLDLAYGEWSPLNFFTLFAGRFPQIHFSPGGSETVLDDDLALEGAGFTSQYEFMPKFFLFGSAGSTFVRENYDTYYSQEIGDNMLNFAQLGIKWKVDRWQWVVGAGFYNFTSVQGKNFSDLVKGGSADGNSEDPAGVVKYPYLPIEYFTELKLPLGVVDAKLFAQRIYNKEAPAQNQALWTGFELGQKSWDFSLAYTKVGSDAVLAMFTASDIGDGVTDVHGWLGRVRWKFSKNMNVRLSQWVQRTDMTGFNKEYRRTNLDLSASF